MKSDHDLAYDKALRNAEIEYDGVSPDKLLVHQAFIRNQIIGCIPHHVNIARLEVINKKLKELKK